jgi:hypothetical protein
MGTDGQFAQVAVRLLPIEVEPELRELDRRLAADAFAAIWSMASQ